MSDNPIIVIDNGSHTLRGGIAGGFEPSYSFPSHVTRFPVTKHHTQMYAGNDIVKSPKESKLSKVLDNDDDDNIDWDGLEKLYRHLLYDKLAIDQDKHKLAHHIAMQRKNKIFLTHSPFTSNKIKSKTCQMLFEKFNCDGLYFGITSTCSLYAHARTTGLVVDSGYKSTYVAPIFEGYMLPLFAKRLNYGGFTLDKLLKDLINSKQRHRFSERTFEITLEQAEKIKIDTAYAAMDFTADDESVATTLIGTARSAPRSIHSRDYPIKYALPDGKEIKMIELFSERFHCVEAMFQPHLYDSVKDQQALPYAIHQAITKGDHHLHKEMFKNIVLSGGNTMITGMKQRLSKDVTHLSPASVRVEIDASPQRQYASWTGASLMAGHSEMDDIWVTPDLYREYGSVALTIRCF